MSNLTPDDATIEAMDLRLEIAGLETEHAVLRAQLAVLASRAKETETHGIMADYKRDELRAALREIGEIVGVSLSVDAAHVVHTSVVDEVRAVVAKIRDHVAELIIELTISRARLRGELHELDNGMREDGEANVYALRARVKELEAQERWTKMAEEDIDAARNLFVAAGAAESYDGGNSPSCFPDCARAIIAQRDDALGAMAAQDEREKVAGEMCGVLYHLHGCDWPDAVAERVVALEAQAKHQSVNLAEYLAGVNACAIAKTLLADAQVCVRKVIEENADKWGERLMHKQQPAIDCDAAITAFLEGK